MTVILIAAAHGLAVFIIALVFRTRSKVWVAAAASTVVAVLKGQLMYLPLDLAAILLVLKFCLAALPKTPAPQAEPPAAAQALPQPQGGNGAGWGTVVGVLAAVGLAVLLMPGDKKPAPAAAPAPAPVQQQLTAPPRPAPNPAPAARQKASAPAKPRPAPQARPQQAPSVEQCLRIVDEQRMVACLERAR